MFIEKVYKLNPVIWLNIKIKWLLRVILLGFSLLLPVMAYAQDTSQSTVYTVKAGDSLTRIAISYGSPDHWKSIFEANRDKIQDPNVIYTGQELRIPHHVSEPEKLVHNTKEELNQQDQPKQSQKTDKEEDHKTLEKFRQAFEQVVNQKKEREKRESTDVDYGLDLGGLVINETRSKMGNDFFNIFYKHWSAPENAGNFLLTITEQPIPSMGTLVTVQIDNQQVFKARLQPRYAITEKLAKQAVAITYYRLHQQLSIPSQITAY